MITDPQIKACIHKHHLFSALGEEELGRLLGQAAKINLAAHENLFYQGDLAKRFYLVIQGHLQLYRTSMQGQDKVIEVVREGRTFAEALMFSRQASYPVSAQAVSHCTLISFDSEGYLAMLRGNPDACIAIMAEMSVRLRKDINEVELLSVQNAQSRLLLFLLRNLQKTGDNQGRVELDIPKRVLASRLSIQPETFSRLMKKMVTEGIISESRGAIEIKDLSKLYTSANMPLANQDVKPEEPLIRKGKAPCQQIAIEML
ncbi:Crp/Fnr family transcriptional regulator [Shewanella insulae]|uniref:Cyclic nucleotide-binding domain-containing protein n=1 Tax=Shewanella insulae TaxID=2681496 RepID=A0A6L7HVY2_9GAMM|nr:Crp/Fnr family transcriptional regulator [Shewanella insulae]MCG9712436.1 Crp/Fnr family transcriptional regulator [Shewanella insulae]MCG9738427.1 Crp/Fnr family transcriptional regulator [Shewanella insulae]MCG9754289.1 Crp/Fnr family transcriptional regulator [Shewanella insulae]MXR67804.1 cyclic nucleotide-binding domain-containing protein [Shewanella insulae]